MKKLTLALLALSILSLIGQLLVLPYLPDTVPTHWNAAGEIDGYGSKYTNLFLSALPLLMLGLFALTPGSTRERKAMRSTGRHTIFSASL